MFRKRHSKLSESEVIALAKKKQEHFGILYEKYFDLIFRFVFKRLGGEEDLAADLTQQTFIKAMVNIHRYEDRGLPFSSWLYRIAQNEVTMHFRAQQKNKFVDVEVNAINTLLTDVVESSYMSLEMQQRLVELVNGLKEEHMDLIELRYFQGMSFKEIADIYNITEANAKMKVYRILDKLKEKW